ncbi:hypothetical protein ZTR_04828 [Talaromyces verruculosus]|nr:hypothetical protein ZTR_04828 [Talaromyces verruculosus]
MCRTQQGRSKGKRVCDKGPRMGDGFGRKELREGGFCFGGSAARKAINHYLGHETDVTEMREGARRNGESKKGKEKRKEMVEKPSFALGRSQQSEKSRKARERVREGGKCWWSGERARGRERAREGLPGAAIGPSAVMPGAEKPARRPLMEAGTLKLRVVVSTPSPGTAVHPLPLELSINFHLYMDLAFEFCYS